MNKNLLTFLAALLSKMISFKNLCALMLVLLFSGGVWGQSCANYTVARTTGITYSSIASTGTSISGTWRNALSTDDNLSAAQNIGFPFYYRGVSYTQFSISTNGFLTFNTGTAAIGSLTGAYGYQNTMFSTASGSVTTLAPFYDDQQTAGNLATQADLDNTYKYLLSGTTGNRVATIEWINSQDFSSTSTSSFNYQIKLYESDGHIEFIYGAMTLANSGTVSIMSYSLGINGQTITATPTAAELLTQQTVNTTTFSATASNALGGATPGNMPEANSMISFTPSSASAPTALTFSNVGSGAMRLNWTDNSTDELSFIIERSTDNITFTTLATLAANTATYNAINLAPNTNYYFKVSPVREAKGTALSGNQTTAAAPTLASVISIDGNTAVPGTSYPTITAAVADLGGTIASAITLELTSTYNAANETYPIQLPYVAGSSATNTLTIMQASGVSGTIIDSSNASSTFIIDRGNYWIIDGRSGGTGSTKDLVISNSSVTGTAIQLINDASYNTLKYCTLKGVNTSVSSGEPAAGVVVIGSTSTTAATGNDYNTITYNDIRDGASLPKCGLYSKGLSTGTNNNNTISYNNIYNFFTDVAGETSYGIYITSGNNDITIDNNSVYQTSTRTVTANAFNSTTGVVMIGIGTTSSSGYNYNVTNNYVGGSAPQAAGTALTVTSAATTNYSSTASASSSGTTINVASTTGLVVGMYVYVISGTGVITAGTTVASITSATAFVVSTAPTTAVASATVIAATSLRNFSFQGIRMTNLTSSTASSIQNNTINNLNITTFNAASAQGAIIISAACVNINNNTIGDPLTSGSTASIIFNNGQAGNAEFNGIRTGSSNPGPISITNNIIAGISINQVNGIGTTDFMGIHPTGTNVSSSSNIVSNNIIGSTTVSNSIINSSAEEIYGIYFESISLNNTASNNIISNLSSTSTNPKSKVYGIFTKNTAGIASGTNTISGNTIAKLSTSSLLERSSATSMSISNISLIGINALNTVASSNSLISGNTIYGLKNTSTSTSSHILGIHASGATTTGSNIVEKNNIYNLGLASSTQSFQTTHGIMTPTSGSVATIKNNFIRLGYDADGTEITNPQVMYGIYDQPTAGSSNVWNNTIFIGGSNVTTGTNPTYCFVSSTTTIPRAFQNNIFINARSNGAGLGKHYAVWYVGATTNPTGLTSNYNLFRATGTGGTIGYYNASDRDLTSWRSATGQDANSLDTDPVLNSPTATTPNLHLTNVSSVASGAATFIASVTDDIDGQPRSGATDVGADEIGIPNCWTGTTNTDFGTTTNWEDGTVPVSGNNIVIPSTVINNPVLDADRTIGTLNIGTNKIININDKILTINGAITGAGTIKGSATSSLVLAGTAGTLNFTSGSRTLKDLTLNSSATATLGTALDITAGTTSGTVTVGTSATLTTGGNLTLKSDANGTARVGNSAGTITGNVTVERYIPFGKRAFRFLTPSVTTASSIYTNWQIGGATTAGRGTHITGSTTGANGFDITASGNPSMYTYQNNVASGTGWLAIPDTNTTTLVAGMGYRTLVRGDRNVNISVASADNMNVATTLSATGTLKVGNVVFDGTTTPALNTTSNTLTDGYSLIGNPYASPVDWELVSRTNVDDYYYAWDPNMGTTAERGRYVAYSASTHQATNTGTGNTNVSKYIQPGQAIFVKTIGASPSLTFEEADKASTFTNVFRTSSNSTLSVAVYNPSEVAFASPIDATIAVFATDFDASVGLGDIEKLYSSGEHLAWSRGDKLLAMDATTPVVTNDELLLKTMQFSANKSYTFKVNATNFDTSLNGYLVDQYLSSQTQLDFSTSNFITFATTTDAASYGANRFKIVFQNAMLNTDTFATQVGLYPNPSKGNGFYLQLPSTTQATVKLYNTLGQEIAISNNEGHYQAKQSLAAGVYHIMVTQGEKTSKLKWIVE